MARTPPRRRRGLACFCGLVAAVVASALVHTNDRGRGGGCSGLRPRLGRTVRRTPAYALSENVQNQMRGLPKKPRRKSNQGFTSTPEASPLNKNDLDSDPKTKIFIEEASPKPPVVAVLGASGRLGSSIIRQLKLKNGEFNVRAVVRNKFDERTKESLQWLGVNDSVVESDVTKPSTLRLAVEGAEFVVFAAGAGAGGNTQNIRKALPNDLGNNFGEILENIPSPDKVADAILFGGFERVDNRGVANVAAVCAGLSKPPSRIILISSIGVTRFPFVQLASLAGDVLQQKRKGELAVEASGIPYTIIRPGGLTTQLERNQALRLTQGDTDFGSVTRDDVAKACIEILRRQGACINSTFEIVGDASKLSVLDWDQALGRLLPDTQVKSQPEKILGFDPFNPKPTVEKMLKQLPSKSE